MRPSLVILLVVLPSVTWACEWDTDTLAEEANYGRDFVATITGRFPRNPPLYYQMRRDRLLAKPNKNPDEYDDLAVAYEKLGDSLAALKWIDRKPHGSASDEYRSHANRGTFLIHAWLAGKLDASAGRRGLTELETAIKINPNAHFGRERVQIALVRELLDPSGRMPSDKDPFRGAEGYAGIVRLGAGWESPDVFRAMAIDLAQARERDRPLGAVASLALLRADELVREGHAPLLKDDMDFRMVEGAQSTDLADETRGDFDDLRREADAWEARRTAFMLPRLKTGRHPDTDSTFWQGWTNGAPPKIEHHWITDTFGRPIPWYWVAFGGLLAVAFIVLPLLGLYFAVRAVSHGATQGQEESLID